MVHTTTEDSPNELTSWFTMLINAVDPLLQ